MRLAATLSFPANWPAHYGPAFDRLLARRVVIESAPISDWDVCDDCECGLLSRAVRAVGDGFRANCPLDRRLDVVLNEDDLRMFRISASGLARQIGSAVGLNGEPSLIAGNVWHLGATPSGRTIFLALEIAALTTKSIVTSIRQAAGFYLVETQVFLSPTSEDRGATIETTALDPIPQAPVLRVVKSAAEVHWSGRSVILLHQLFPVFQRLLDKALSRDPVASGPYLEDTTGREAKKSDPRIA